MWVRGLKHTIMIDPKVVNDVAPYVGAWIETQGANSKGEFQKVAPYVGAWIETISLNINIITAVPFRNLPV